MISAEYLLHMQCYKVANLQHLIVAEYYTSSFPIGFIAILSYYIDVLIMCYIPSATYLLHMQCCWVSKIKHLIAAEYTVVQSSTE